MAVDNTKPRYCISPGAKRALKVYLPVALVVVIIFAVAVPAPGQAAGDTPLNTICIIGLFLISGLGLKTDDAKKALGAWRGIIFGLLSILVITPTVAFAAVELPLTPKEFAVGVGLFALMPTTISSGYILTGEAKGNQPLSLLLSVASNMLGVITVPLWLSAVLSSSGASIDAGGILGKLSLTILLPLVVGKVIRCWKPVPAFISRHKPFFKVLSSTLLVLIPWTKVSSAADDLLSVDGGMLFLMFVMGFSLHVILFTFNFFATMLVPGLHLYERKAVVMMSGQKTLSIATALLEFLPAEAGKPGLVVIPMVVSHLSQILFDAVVAVRWSSVEDPMNNSHTFKGLPLDDNGSYRAGAISDEDDTQKLVRAAVDAAEGEEVELAEVAVEVQAKAQPEARAAPTSAPASAPASAAAADDAAADEVDEDEDDVQAAEDGDDNDEAEDDVVEDEDEEDGSGAGKEGEEEDEGDEADALEDGDDGQSGEDDSSAAAAARPKGDEFFAEMRRQKEAEEAAKLREEKAMLDAMEPEEREKYIAEKKAREEHELRKDRSNKALLKRYASKSRKKSGRGRGRGRGRKKP